jgi:hypothetical protein
MLLLGSSNRALSRYNLHTLAVFPRVCLVTNSMCTIKRYLRCALLGLIFVLTASLNLFCVVVDNDGDGDPTTGVTIEFSAVQGKRIQVASNLKHVHSPLALEVLRTGFFHKQLFKRSDSLDTTSGFFNLIDLLASPLRC